MSVFDSDVRYLQAYKIPELFDDLMRQLLSERPSQPVSFLGSKLNAASTLSAEEFNAIVGPVANEPLALDLTDAAAWDRVYDTADKLLQTFVTVDRLRAVENALLAKQRELPTMVHLAAKLATSKALLATCPPVFVTMLVALYNEKNRMSTKQEHPNGENFLVNKAREMEWLFEAAPASSWEIVYVDDGCPQGSGKLAEERIKSNGIPNSRVDFLQRAIDEKDPTFADIKDTKDSQKGGAIEFGMWEAAKGDHGDKEHIVIFTDADLAANLSQTGLLVFNLTSSPSRMSCVGSRYDEGGIFCNEKGAINLTSSPSRMSCVGSRYDEGGIFCNEKGAMGVTKNFELLAFRDFLKRLLLPALGKGRDTQCGFKAFKASVVKKVIPSVTDRKFSFDMQLLMLVALQCGGQAAMGSEAVVYVDSLAESNFYQQAPGVDPMLESYKSYFNMMGRMLALHDTFKDKQEVPAANQPVIDFVRGLTLETFSKMMATMPRMQGKPDWGRVFTLPELQSWKSGVVLNAANYSNGGSPTGAACSHFRSSKAGQLDIQGPEPFHGGGLSGPTGHWLQCACPCWHSWAA
eukprot:CAMPEP_0174382430 /NCGR_PEP_ID=MMETSP0811_2-20130205/124590_1 /TAXON_ID=73025 ORGANISM="Eutreptiella gymnastica-like, Strain CCMP1594" /NCGR_SAMPLE_ID=MMETSP0811_2 /ASSEMBLY_ACC=CAM_ASM_000667 /LENGTH=575 /DNA_ID=CAMNT_0015535743 /DNA_START=36 /DNA_END=1763 /DNA_ORIENTATION=+